MLRSGEEEKEILLGNKQLLGIFFVVALLLGIAFTGGYMVGRGSGNKSQSFTPVTQETASSAAPAGTGGETHSVSPEPANSTDTAAAGHEPAKDQTQRKAETGATESEEVPLGTPQRKQAEGRPRQGPDATVPPANGSFFPRSGQEFLQVAAVGKDEAEAVADVLAKKGFRAHAVPKPGNPKIYRVLVGPIRDPGDLSNTRDALRRTGFREIVLQRY